MKDVNSQDLIKPKTIDRQILGDVLDDLKTRLENIRDRDHYIEPIEEMWELLNQKGDDYSGNHHHWMSFVIEAAISNVSIDTIFLTSFARKFSRLISLLRDQKDPHFESVEDSWIDLLGYLLLYVSWKRYERIKIDEDISHRPNESSD